GTTHGGSCVFLEQGPPPRQPEALYQNSHPPILKKKGHPLFLTPPNPADDFGSYIAHPLANMFPMIEGQALEDLKHDIAAKGILEPIRLYQGMILDGRNRYSAARAVGHTFTLDDFVQWEAKQSSGSSQPTF